LPVPATVVITPVLAFTSRMRFSRKESMKRSPAESTATLLAMSMAAVAGPPSPP